MNEDSKDENLTQSPAGQSGFVADYTQAGEASSAAEVPADSSPVPGESSDAEINSQPEAVLPQTDVSGDSPSAVDAAEVAPQEEISEMQPETVVPAEIPQEEQAAVPAAPVMEEVPGIDVSAGEAEINAGVGVDEVEVIEPIDDTLDALSGDL